MQHDNARRGRSAGQAVSTVAPQHGLWQPLLSQTTFILRTFPALLNAMTRTLSLPSFAQSPMTTQLRHVAGAEGLGSTPPLACPGGCAPYRAPYKVTARYGHVQAGRRALYCWAERWWDACADCLEDG